MEKISCIILNYNDSATTVGLVRELEEYQCIDDIVVVDNHSSDEDWTELRRLTMGLRVHLIRTKENGGYGRGNQVGINYAVKRFSPDYIMIANPDIHVAQTDIMRVLDALKRQEDGAVASAMVLSPDGRRLQSSWDLLPLWKELLDAGPVLRRLFKRIIATSPENLTAADTEGCRLVGAVCGSFFLIKMSCFTAEQARRIFDKNLFLYCEEKALGQKLRSMGLKEVLVTDTFYIHAHSVSIDKNVGSITAKQRILHRSRLYYYRRYLHAGPVAMIFARLYLAMVLCEIRFLTEILGMRW